MHEYELGCWWTAVATDEFKEAVIDLIGTDDALTITRDGKPVAVIIDFDRYNELASLVAPLRGVG